MEQLILPGILLEVCNFCNIEPVEKKNQGCKKCLAKTACYEPDRLPFELPVDGWDF